MFDRYPDYEYNFAQAQLVFFMLGMGAQLRLSDFARLMRQPRSFLAGAVALFIVTPLLAVLVSQVGVEPGIAVGLVLVAAMPGGTLAKAFTYIGHGNLALSLGLTLCATLASVVTVPLMLRLLAAGYISESFVMPADLVCRDVGLYLLLPLALGMLSGGWLGPRRDVFSRWCIRGGFVFVGVMIVGSAGSGRIHPAEYGWRAPLAIIIFCQVGQKLSTFPFWLMNWPRADSLAVGVEVTMRNLNLALLLKALLFPAKAKGIDPVADAVLFVILFYALVAMFVGLPLALRHRLRARREAAVQARTEEAVLVHPT